MLIDLSKHSNPQAADDAAPPVAGRERAAPVGVDCAGRNSRIVAAFLVSQTRGDISRYGRSQTNRAGRTYPRGGVWGDNS